MNGSESERVVSQLIFDISGWYSCAVSLLFIIIVLAIIVGFELQEHVNVE